MTGHAETEVHFAGSNKLFLSIWVWLLLLTGFEVFLGYIQLPVVYMLVILMGASIIKAALIVAYFMHLRFERLNLVLTIVPALVICICLMLLVFSLTVFAPGTFVLQRRLNQPRKSIRTLKMRDARKSLIRSVVTLLSIAWLGALSADSALAQCVMCRASIGQNSLFARNLNIGVLVLLVPPVAMFCTIFVLAFRHRKSG